MALLVQGSQGLDMRRDSSHETLPIAIISSTFRAACASIALLMYATDG